MSSKTKTIGICILALLTVGSFFDEAFPAKEDGSITYLEHQHRAISEAAKKIKPSVVNIQSVRRVSVGSNMEQFPFWDFFDFFGQPQPRRSPQMPDEYLQQGQGTGFIIDSKGHIITNDHVVGDADEVTVTLWDGKEYEAEVVGVDPSSDVAVIKIDAENLQAADVGDSENIEVGAPVIAVGNPFGLEQTVTFGIVSAVGRRDVAIGATLYKDYIQTDAAINPGNSGGPLCDLKGRVIGINTAIYSRSGGYMGIGFAIPMNMAMNVTRQLIDTGKVTRGWLGVSIQSLSQEHAEAFGYDGTEGALVGEVFEDSPADKAGVENGDIILEFNGKKIEDSSHLMNVVGSTPPGSKVSLVVFRKGGKKRFTVVLDERDLETAQAAPAEKSSEMASLGIEVQELTEELSQELGYEDKEGVIVVQVDPTSEAARKGIKRGYLIDEVDRKPVTSVEEFNKAVSSASTDKILIHVTYDGGSAYVVLSLKK